MTYYIELIKLSTNKVVKRLTHNDKDFADRLADGIGRNYPAGEYKVKVERAGLNTRPLMP